MKFEYHNELMEKIWMKLNEIIGIFWGKELYKHLTLQNRNLKGKLGLPALPDVDQAIMGQHARLAWPTSKSCEAEPTHARKEVAWHGP